jgi:hypothetical protein
VPTTDHPTAATTTAAAAVPDAHLWITSSALSVALRR